MKNNLIFSKGNSKIDAFIFDLPAGYTCPGANVCKVMAERNTGKLSRGENNLFSCYAANAEMQYKNCRVNRWHNFDLLKNKSDSEILALIESSYPKKARKIRLHSSGDFFNISYFHAWVNFAILHPEILIYGYTKSVNYLLAARDILPDNFKFVASCGGKYDNLIEPNNLRYCKVIFSLNESGGLPIEHGNDELCYNYDGNFCILLHGMQAKNSKAGEALKLLKRSGVNTGYNKNHKKRIKK